ncbi:hypothetical protein, partial [Haloferula sp. A504]|uniref:hypothetical protein n=1 Tax=Haloferula sp. A504 TaxID=3373601 RepID=UPI0031C52C82|nr:hypothetical protein [Verrucomicrobiaceae bacterium E54]
EELRQRLPHGGTRFLARHLAVPESTLRRWRSRHRRGQTIRRKPGLAKPRPLPIAGLREHLHALHHGNHRSAGTGKLHDALRDSLSRRDTDALVARLRERHHQHQKDHTLHLTWHRPNLVWAIDATHLRTSPQDPGVHPVLARDLASHFHFQPLLLEAESADANLQWLRHLIELHGPPLFLKRDNGSPFNTDPINELLAQYGILPLNSPICQPTYNGAIEHGIGAFKRELAGLLDPSLPIAHQPALPRLVHAVTHLRNTRRRRSLGGISPATAYHHHPHFAPSALIRRQIFEWISARAEATLGMPWETSDHHARSAAWRRAVEAWLRCQGLVTVSRTPKPSPIFATQKRS